MTPSIRKMPINEYRYERKFTTTEFDTSRIEHMIRLHPEIFKEIFYKRQVNNIYFDTLGLKNFHDNVKGNSQRLKIRIRWYGPLLGEIKNPILEVKIKNGYLGKKISTPLNSFMLDKNFKIEILKTLIQESNAPGWVKQEVKESIPTTLSHYERKYFQSASKKFRITIDENLGYYRIKNKFNTFKDCHIDRTTKIIEVKYNQDSHKDAKKVTGPLKFRLSPSSKYVNGVNLLEF